MVTTARIVGGDVLPGAMSGLTFSCCIFDCARRACSAARSPTVVRAFCTFMVVTTSCRVACDDHMHKRKSYREGSAP
jgi:hypothetical protein